MADHISNPTGKSGAGGAVDTSAQLKDDESIPAMQLLLDNPFLLLFLGVVIPTVLYILWGVMEILSLPNAPL